MLWVEEMERCSKTRQNIYLGNRATKLVVVSTPNQSWFVALQPRWPSSILTDSQSSGIITASFSAWFKFLCLELCIQILASWDLSTSNWIKQLNITVLDCQFYSGLDERFLLKMLHWHLFITCEFSVVDYLLQFQSLSLPVTSDVNEATTPEAEAKTHETKAKFTRLRFEKLTDL